MKRFENYTKLWGGLPCMNSREFGFTLAEVLITLGIIGVVAALTMPSLITNHRNKVFAVRAKKAYSAINQAVKLYEAQNETPGDVTGLFDPAKHGQDAEIVTAFSKFFDAPQLCLQVNSSCRDYHPRKYSKPLYTKDENGNFKASQQGFTMPLFVTKDGTMIAVHQATNEPSCNWTQTGSSFDEDRKESESGTWTNGFCANIYFDTNGDEPPNQFGYDAFEIRIRPDGKFEGWAMTGWDSLRNIMQGGDPVYENYTVGTEFGK